MPHMFDWDSLDILPSACDSIRRRSAAVRLRTAQMDHECRVAVIRCSHESKLEAIQMAWHEGGRQE